jgi:hypothetical protein
MGILRRNRFVSNSVMTALAIAVLMAVMLGSHGAGTNSYRSHSRVTADGFDWHSNPPVPGQDSQP